MKKKLLLIVAATLLSMASVFAQGGTTGPLTWELNDGTLTISGTGAMPNYEWGGAPWYPYVESIGAVVIENGVATIGDYAFMDCIYLASITMPNSVLTIGYSAFSQCSALILITIPNSVLSIGQSAFSNCQALISVTLGDNIKTLASGTFFDCVSLISIILPNSLTTIESSAFAYCSSLISIILPNSLTTIRGDAFFNCGLSSITIPNSVTTIESYAFSNCYSLSSINVENGNANYSSMDGVLFDKDKTILVCYPAGKTNSSYTVPNSVITIENSAFRACWKLTSITLGNNVTTIRGGAFNSFAFNSITIPRSVTTIEIPAFTNGDSFTSIEVENENENFSSVDGILFDKEKTILICYPMGKTNNSYTISDGVTTIGYGAFYGCLSLTSVTLGNSITTIENYAFRYCNKLTSVILGNSVTTIGDDAFGYCFALTSVTLGNGITSMGHFAFGYCSALTSVTNLNPDPIDISYYNVFYGVEISACTLKVPKSSVSAYQAAEVWKDFNIVGGLLVNVSINNDNYGYATGNDLYETGATATVTATPYEGYKFVNWTKDGVEISTENPYSFTVTEDVELVANFEVEVGIKNLEVSDINIYPNPTSGELRMENGNGKDARPCVSTIKNIEIFDIYGRKLNLSTCPLVHSFTTTIDISHLQSGIYFVKITTETGVVVKKVVKE